MNQELRKRWVAALRSGTFKQTKKILHDIKEDAYCCLGVLCKIENLPEKVVKFRIDLHSEEEPREVGRFGCHSSRSCFSESELPRNFAVQVFGIGTRNENGSFMYPNGYRDDTGASGSSLALLNDAGFTFDQIADIIDWYWEEEETVS